MGESYCYLKKSKRDAEKPKAQTLIVFTVQLSTVQCCEPAKNVIILEINSGNVLRAIVVKKYILHWSYYSEASSGHHVERVTLINHSAPWRRGPG